MQNKRVVKLISSNSKKETQYVEKEKKKKIFLQNMDVSYLQLLKCFAQHTLCGPMWASAGSFTVLSMFP